ncbi:Integrase core domain protein [compost metagenome]
MATVCEVTRSVTTYSATKGVRRTSNEVVLALYARRVMGRALSEIPDSDLLIRALDVAYEQRGVPQGLLFHSDQGSQYGSRHFRQRLWRYRMRQSMSHRGDCRDNAPVERVFSSLKTV